MTDVVARELADAARLEVESGAVGLAGIVRTRQGIRLLLTQLYWVPETAYERRDADCLVITSPGFVPALLAAEKIGRLAIWIHTHPHGTPAPSPHDDDVDALLAFVFADRTGSDVYASLVVSPANSWWGFDFTGRAWFDLDQPTVGLLDPVPVGRTLVVGDRLAVTAPHGAPALHDPADDDAMFGRQVRAFGAPVQRAVEQLRVAVVGVGGTGSAVTEQLTRLGVRALTLVDPDVLSASNITRVFGSTPDDVGRPKVEVAAAHVLRLAPSASIRTIRGKVTELAIAKELRDSDVIFGCTDDNAGRQVLSRLSAYYLLPVIDMGVLLDSVGGHLNGIFGRVTTLLPGAACLICRGRVDLARATAELLPAAERHARIQEGYAPELPGVEPAVVAYTALTASLAINELLDRLVGHGPRPSPTELLIRVHDRELSTNNKAFGVGHYCDPSGPTIGAGDRELFLEQVWAG
jgi:molybdopterin/thiamine biosynthesis adenylyltransferase